MIRHIYYVIGFIALVVSAAMFGAIETACIALSFLVFTLCEHLLEFWVRKQTLIDTFDKRIKYLETWNKTNNDRLSKLQTEAANNMMGARLGR